MAITTRYFKIIGVNQNDDNSLTYALKPVADFAGAPLTTPTAAFESYTTQPGANELPRGTIVKVVDTQTRQITVNPTS